MHQFVKACLGGVMAASLVSAASAREGDVPRGVAPLSHVFLIVMENHGYAEVIGNPNRSRIASRSTPGSQRTTSPSRTRPSRTTSRSSVGPISAS